jgi:hypothetical protein
MTLLRFRPSGKLGDDVELAEELAHHLAGVVSLAEDIEVGHDALDRLFGLGNRAIGVVLPLALETSTVFQKLFPKELGETATGGPT